MYPVICQWGPVAIYSYGVMLAIAVLACSYLASREAHLIGIQPQTIFDLVFWLVTSGILGARLFYILLNYHFFLDHPEEILMIQKGGLAWHGGLVAATWAGMRFVRKKGLPLTATLDLAAPYVALGEAIGRVGCFLNGCCYGREVVWGIYFPVHHAHLHPTQLYAMVGLVVFFFILKRYRRVATLGGDVFVFYLFGASLLRFIIEFFRADHDILVAGLSVFQWVCLGIILVAMYVHLRLKSRARASA